MHAILYNFALAAIFGSGMATLIGSQRHTQGYMQTLKDVELATVAYLGENCQALPPTVTQAQLQSAGNLPVGFNAQGADFTVNLGQHPNVSVNVTGNAGYLAFLSTHTLGGFETDGSYSFLPSADITFFRGANSSYNLFAYAENDFSCTPL